MGGGKGGGETAERRWAMVGIAFMILQTIKYALKSSFVYNFKFEATTRSRQRDPPANRRIPAYIQITV